MDASWSVVRVGRLGASLADRTMVPVQEGLTFDQADRLARRLTRAVQLEGAHWPWVAYTVRQMDPISDRLGRLFERRPL